MKTKKIEQEQGHEPLNDEALATVQGGAWWSKPAKWAAKKAWGNKGRIVKFAAVGFGLPIVANRTGRVVGRWTR